MPATRLQIKSALQSPYDRLLFAKEVLKPVFGSGFNLLNTTLEPTEKPSFSETKVIDSVRIYANINLEDGTEITCYEIVLQPNVLIERSKVIIQKYIRKILTSGQVALVNFIAPINSDIWRLTLIAKDSILTDDGVEERYTHAKRYTYLVGPSENCRTVAERLETLSFEKTINFDALINAFSVEKLNKAFYKDITEQFYQLIGATIGKGKNIKVYDRALHLPGISSENNRVYQEFAVRLIGRTVFCWFLKVKKSEAGVALLPENLLSSISVKENQGYYHTILEKLFFQTLNTPIANRIKNLPKGSNYIPFLNGGLFEAQLYDYYKFDELTGLSANLNTLIIPDQWFLDFFEKLEQYNFTIDENSVTDVEVSVDPEMLGSIFENLLAEIDPDSGETARKATGSFYTPREIVDYMATESLVYYLHSKTLIEKERIELIFKIDSDLDFKLAEREDILLALDKLKILDPACGSGAFPMGILQKIVIGLQKLDNNAEWWIDQQVNKNDDVSTKNRVREKLEKNPDYARKIGIIQNSLYGVDIQPIAAEISKLRCFLTLIVDEHIDEDKPNRGIEPLPNLEFKFVTADTLLKLPDETTQVPMYNAKKKKNPLELLAEIQQVRLNYLESFGDNKISLKEKFHELQKEIFDQQGLFGAVENNRAFKISNWKPFSHEKTDWFDSEWMFGVKGFDIVIGNPPYGTVYNKTVKPIYEKLYPSFKRNNDIYVAFFVNANKLLLNSGILIFITPNTFLNGDYFEGLRSYITNHFQINEIIDFKNSKIFSDPTVYVSITSISKIEISYPYTFSYKLSDAKFKNIKRSGIDISSATSSPLKPIKAGVLKISVDESNLLDHYFFVKDVGFNYWSIGKGKKRDGDSIGNRILYSGKRLSENDKSYIKGRDIEKFKISPASNYLKSDYQYFLKEGVDVFRYSHEILNVIPKIVYRQTSSSIIAALDSDANLCDKTVHIIIPRHENVQFDLKYLLCLLNSSLMDFLYKDISQESGGRAFAQVKTTYIKKLPLKVVSIENQVVFCNIVDYIKCINSGVLVNEFVNVKITNSIIKSFEKTIDALVNEIYFENDFKAAKLEIMAGIKEQFVSINNKSPENVVKTIRASYSYIQKIYNNILQGIELVKLD